MENNKAMETSTITEAFKHAKAIFRKTNGAVINVTTNGIIVNWNSATQKLYGYTKEELLEKSVTIFFEPDRKDEFEFFFQKIKNGESIHDFETEQIKKNGKKIHVRITTHPIQEQKNRTVGASIISRDVTQEKEYEKLQHELLQREILAHTEVEIARKHIYNVIMQTPAIFIVLLGKDHRYEFLNNAAREIINNKNIIGKTFKEVFPELTVQLATLDKVYKTGKPIVKKEDRATYEWKSGKIEEKFFNEVYQPIRNDKNQVIGVMYFGFDITEQVLARQKVEESQKLLQTIIDGSNSIIFLKDLEGRYITVNNQFKKMLGLPGDEIKGKTDYDIFPQETADAYRSNDLKVLKNKEALQWEESLLHHGKQYTYLSVKFPLLDTKNKAYAIGSISTDITERKDLEKRKDEFITVASHELKTPVTSLKANAQLLQKEFELKGDKYASLRLSDMNEQLDKLTKLIKQLLDLSKINAGKLEYNPERFPIDDLITETAKTMQATTNRQKIVIKTLTKNEVFADKDRIGQVLINIISNAIKYSPIEGKIIISSEEKTNEVIVNVKDFGIGIDKTKQKNIFERFYRVNDPIEKTFSGLGIGLYISAEIIKRHKGTIWVKSKKGEGSTFSFSLPILHKKR